MDGDTAIPGEISLEALEAQITELCGHLNAAQYRWLILIREFDRRGGWHDGKLASCAHWLNFKCGINLGAAREKVRVAHALEGLPRIAAAMARGELSYSKVRALTRAACPATEETLLMIALHGTAHHVESIVRRYRRAQEAELLEREERQQAGRGLSYWYDEDGSLVIKARVPALGGALLVKALEAGCAQVPATDYSVTLGEEVEMNQEQRLADALVHLAERYFEPVDGAPDRAERALTADRYQVVVHVDAKTLQSRTSGRCEVEQGPALAVETARRLSCDASLVALVENEDGSPLDVGRKTRTIPPSLRRALNARDAGCRFPGCTNRQYLDAHHVDPWVEGGQTNLGNLVTLCRRHHRLLHEGGLRVEREVEGGWRFFKPDGEPFDRPLKPCAHDGHELARAHAAQGLHIDASTAATRWCGESMDYHLGVGTLCLQAERSRQAAGPQRPCDVSAGTLSFG